MKKILLPVFILLLLAGFKALDSRTIEGIVTDKYNGIALPGVVVSTDKSGKRTSTDGQGHYRITVSEEDKTLIFAMIGYQNTTKKIGRSNKVNVSMDASQQTLSEVVVAGYAPAMEKRAITASLSGTMAGVNTSTLKRRTMRYETAPLKTGLQPIILQDQNTESYGTIQENTFRNPFKDPLSTFSIDVDAAAYSNVRRFINNGAIPPRDAVRIEEMVNYFDYEYPQPNGDDPVNIITETAPAPWNPAHQLVQIGLQGKTIKNDRLPASNLVFLIDVSGSMNVYNRLPLLVSSLKMLTDQLREQDKVSIVVYAGNSGLVLPATPGNQKMAIKSALDKLSAGGSTAGGAGIRLAYQQAAQNFIKGGNNRVILATDGDFNVGESSDEAMEQLIEDKRKSGVFLTVLGYGMGNLKDRKMEILADKGNGNYAYIDNITEARKVLVNEFGGTLFTIAKDVKLQVEFNPAKVQAYRLIGYENRILADKDFNDDQKDAGDLGSGHTVTALYEVIPVGVKSNFAESVDPLKYQENKRPAAVNYSPELMTVKLRYKQPDGHTSKLLKKEVMSTVLSFNKTSDNFRFAAAVAEFGMLLRQSEFKQKASFDQVIGLAENALGKDREGYRAEFLKLVKSSKLLAKELLTIEHPKEVDENN